MKLAKLALGAVGVVFGDLGTSPLYAVKECFARGPHGVEPTLANVLGVLSLIIWSLIAVIVVKYTTFILLADHHGEGGQPALLAQIDKPPIKPWIRTTMVLLGMAGMALLYGDGTITPAISVLSAVEGLEVVTPSIHRYIVPITVGILLGFFLFQKKGTAKIGAVFGPATLVWFVSIAALGLPAIIRHPEVLGAINPIHAVRFFQSHGMHGFLLLGSVVLCITGGEALFADMGHFGRSPIRWAWYTVVLPALLINYFGQGAILVEQGDAVRGNPFFALVGGNVFLTYGMVVVAAVATVVASQAMVSGAFSITQQAVQFGYCPRVTIDHTSGSAEGQIYIREVNRAIMVGSILLVVIFKESSKLAAAYGIAVIGTMTITSVLFYQITRTWGWARWKSIVLVSVFLTVDLTYLAANVVKIEDGGWIPLAIASVVFTSFYVWKRVRVSHAEHMLATALPVETFLDDVRAQKPHRVQGVAVFMTSERKKIPLVLLHHFKHNKVLHERVLLVSVGLADPHVPTVDSANRVKVIGLGEGLFRVFIDYGFMETPRVPEALEACRDHGLNIDPAEVSYYLGREKIEVRRSNGLLMGMKLYYAFMAKHAADPTDFFGFSSSRVVELGARIQL